jgi:hypothetical protein
MHTTIRTYETDTQKAQEVMGLVEQHFAPKLEHLEGFVAYQVITSPDGKLVSITTCKTPQACTQSDKLAAEFVRDHLSHIRITRRDAYAGEVAFAAATGTVRHAVHA